MAITKYKYLLMMVILLLASIAFAEEKSSLPPKPAREMDVLKLKIKRLEDKLNKMEEENEIRQRLKSTEEEKGSGEDAILETAGRDYTLMKPGNLGLEYSLKYQGDSYDILKESNSFEHNAYHTWTNTFFVEYPLREDLTFNTSLPFVYKSESQSNRKTAKDTSDFGDFSFGLQFQPFKSGEGFPSIIFSGLLSCPTGRSPYKVDNKTELSTGNGYYSLGLGCSASKAVDPIVAFGGLNYSKGLPVHHLDQNITIDQTLREAEPGDTVAFNMGIGYSLSYKVSLTLSYQYAYQMSSQYLVETNNGLLKSNSEGTISSIFSIGTGWNITPKRSFNIRLGIGLTNNDPDFSLLVRIPFTYKL